MCFTNQTLIVTIANELKSNSHVKCLKSWEYAHCFDHYD